MADNHIKAEQDYIRGMKYKDIAEKYGVSINTVKSWKRRYEWSREKGAHKEKGVHTKKRGAPSGNKNALGNDGGAPKGNTNSVKHGLFAKYLPEETLAIMDQIQDISPIDILWMNIKMQFASIMRAQQIMFVESKDEMIKELKKQKLYSDGKSDVESEEVEYEFQFAWDRHSTFLNSQSRAMGELRSLLKQFTEMASADDVRVLEVKRMEAVITKTKKETEFIEERTKLIKGDKKDTSLLEAFFEGQKAYEQNKD